MPNISSKAEEEKKHHIAADRYVTLLPCVNILVHDSKHGKNNDENSVRDKVRHVVSGVVCGLDIFPVTFESGYYLVLLHGQRNACTVGLERVIMVGVKDVVYLCRREPLVRRIESQFMSQDVVFLKDLTYDASRLSGHHTIRRSRMSEHAATIQPRPMSALDRMVTFAPIHTSSPTVR